MLDHRVSVAIRVAIHFGKLVASFVSLFLILIDKKIVDNDDPYSAMEHNTKLGRKLVRMYMIFWKLRRRAMRIMHEAYPDTRALSKNVALGRLFTRMEEVAGKLDFALRDNPVPLSYSLDGEALSQYATSQWGGRPYPPPMIELDYFRWRLPQ